MIMKRKLTLLMAALMIFATMAACGEGGESSVVSSEASSQTEVSIAPKATKKPRVTPEPTPEATPEASSEASTAPSSVQPGQKPDFGTPSEDLYSFQIQINGDLYQFPMTYQQFISYGWVYDDDDTEMLDSNYMYSTMVFRMGDLQCYTSMVNFDINQRPVNECYVGGISLDSYQVEKGGNPQIVLPGGVTFGVTTADEAIAKYGTPTEEFDLSSGAKSVRYRKDFDQEVSMRFDETEKKLEDVEVENMVKPADFVEGTVSTEVPAIVTKYKAPAALSDNFGDWTVEYSGKLYQLPAPVSEFTADGWVLQAEDAGTVINGRGYGWITMVKDNQKLKIIVQNYSESATPAENCFVTNVKADESDCKVSIKISKGITIGMSQADLEGALAGSNFEKEDGSSYVFYEVFPTEKKTMSYEIYVKKETGNVNKIEMSYQPSFADYTAQ